MKRHFITFGLLALAIGAYLLGVAKASLVLVAIGCMIEATLWIRLFHHADQSTPKAYLPTGNSSQRVVQRGDRCAARIAQGCSTPLKSNGSS